MLYKKTFKKYFDNYDYIDDLKNLLKSQNNKCPYTGIELIIGVNASLDHIKPIAAGGKSETQNFQWVYYDDDFNINLMKRDFSHENFLKAIKIIYENINKP